MNKYLSKFFKKPKAPAILGKSADLIIVDEIKSEALFPWQKYILLDQDPPKKHTIGFSKDYDPKSKFQSQYEFEKELMGEWKLSPNDLKAKKLLDLKMLKLKELSTSIIPDDGWVTIPKGSGNTDFVKWTDEWHLMPDKYNGNGKTVKNLVGSQLAYPKTNDGYVNVVITPPSNVTIPHVIELTCTLAELRQELYLSFEGAYDHSKTDKAMQICKDKYGLLIPESRACVNLNDSGIWNFDDFAEFLEMVPIQRGPEITEERIEFAKDFLIRFVYMLLLDTTGIYREGYVCNKRRITLQNLLQAHGRENKKLPLPNIPKANRWC